MTTDAIENQVDTQTGTESAAPAETQANTFTQSQVNDIIADRINKEKARADKKYGNIDVERYNNFIAAEENKALENQKKRGEFDSIIKDQATGFQTEITQLKDELQAERIDGALLSSANRLGAVDAEQVVKLIKDSVRLGEDKKVEVIDADGKIRYTDKGDLMSIDDVTNEFLNNNKHFKAATPSGSGTHSHKTVAVKELDILKLDMKNPKDRDKYREYKKERDAAQ